MPGNKRWSEEELRYLQTWWGRASIACIAQKLGRSEIAVYKQGQKQRLGPQLWACGKISFSTLTTALRFAHSNMTALRARWISAGLPVRSRRFGGRMQYQVELDAFWAWAEAHQSMLNFERFEEGALGAEPEWVGRKRWMDRQRPANRYKPWTAREDALLVNLLEQYSYSYRDLARIFGRSEVSIEQRCVSLGLKLRPIKERRPWTEEEEQTMRRLRAEGHTVTAIARQLDRSEQSCRGKLKKKGR